MGVKISDIAKEVGVSEATVSLALNNKSVVKAETKQKIIEAARRMGYMPNVMAKMLVQQKSNIIGVVVTDPANVYFGEFAKSCTKWILENNYRPLLASSQDEYSVEEQVIDQFIAHRVAGVIIIPATKDNPSVRYLERLESYGIRYLYATAYHQNAAGPCVMVDLKRGAYQSVKYLLDMGHRDIVFMGTDPELPTTKLRTEGYVDAFAERGLEVKRELMIRCEDANFESGYTETLRLLDMESRVDAIVTINDIMALGCLRALTERGKRVPEDISVVGYDDIIFSEVASIPLTTVHQDIDALAKRSVNMVLGMIQNNVQKKDVVQLEPHLVVRNSTGICGRLSERK